MKNRLMKLKYSNLQNAMMSFERANYKLMKKFLLFLLLTVSSSFDVLSQGGSTPAAALASPITLPFSAPGTTVGNADNVNGIIVGGDAGFTSGPDWLYYFCATSNIEVNITLDFTPIAVDGVWPSISVYQGLPGAGTLIASNASVGDVSGTLGTSIIPTSGLCYYVLVDNWPPPDGFAYDISISNPPQPTLQPSCTNMGFEVNNYTGWLGGWGNTVTSGAVGAATPNFSPSTYTTSTNQHAITSGAGIDLYGGFPVVCPGLGLNSLRLGTVDNHPNATPAAEYPNFGGAMIQQKFAIDASNALFTYYYAVVVQDGNGATAHASNEQPFFKVEILDCNNVPIPCGQYQVTGGPGIPNFTLAPGTTDVYYKNWTPSFVDLSAYIGTCVTVKYTVADCSLGGHFCYAYIDANCEPMIVNAPTYICPNTPGTLTSPIGGAGYSWTVAGNPTVIGTTQTISVSPLVLTNYECVVTNDAGCSAYLDFTVDIFPVPTVTSTSTSVCPGVAGTITASGFDNGVAAGGSYSWSPSGVATAGLTQTPAATTVYTVTYTDPNLCTATGTGTITVNPLPVAPVTAPVVYCLNDPTIALTATAAAGCTLNWYGTSSSGGVSTGAVAPIPNSGTAGTTTYYVSQTITATGCEGPRASLVVTVNALPVITVNSPTVCPSIAATLTAVGGVTYVWDEGVNLNVSTSNPYLPSPAVTTIYTVTGTDANGCKGTANSTVTIANMLNITVNSPVACLGSPVTLTAVGGTTYVWDEGTNLNVSTANPFSPSPLVPTTYTVTGTTNGCSGTATSTVTINPVPTTTAGSNSPVCAGVSLNLTAVASVVPGATYSWTGPNGFSSGIQNPTIPAASVNASGTYIVTVLANGCSSTSSVVVVVNPIPSTTAGTNSPCEGSALNLTAVASVVPGVSYSWTGPGGFTSSNQNPTIAASTVAASGTYIVTVLANGCSSTSQIVATVNPIPLTTAGSNSPICAGTALNLTAVTSVVPGVSYSWTGPNGFLSGAQNPSIPASTVAASGTYIATVLANGCSSTSNVLVVVNPVPVTTAGTNSPCEGSALNLTAVTSVVPGVSYSWTGPGGFTSSIQNPIIAASTVAGSGTYIVTVLANGCSSTSQIIATVKPIPTTTAGSNSPICAGTALNLTAVSSVVPGSTYSWTGPNGFTSGLQNPSIPGATVAASGNYTVTVLAAGCSSPSSIAVVVNASPTTVASSTPICAGSNLLLAATTFAGGAYSWIGPNGFTSAVQNPVVSAATVNASGNYTVTVTSNGCSFSSSIVAVVSAPTTPIFLPLATICENDSPPTLPAASLNNPAIVGTWSPNLVSNLVGGNYTFTPNANQCALGTSLSIVVNPLPILPPLVGGEICEPGTINLTAASVTPGAAGGTFSYWTNAACTIPLANPSAVGVGGTYYIQSTSATVPACSVEQPVVVVINPLPLASFTPSPSVLSSLSPYSVMVNNSIGADSYTWDFGDDQTSILASPDHYFPDSDSGTYVITLTALNSITGCVDTAIATVKVNEELIFYVPNTFTPDSDDYNEMFLPVFTSGYDPFDYSLFIYNRWGELIFESHNTEIGWKGLYGVDGTKVQDGTYTWKIKFALKSTKEYKVVVGHVNVLR
jgi:gliding motility-associated-like protein